MLERISTLERISLYLILTNNDLGIVHFSTGHKKMAAFKPKRDRRPYHFNPKEVRSHSTITLNL